MMANGGFAMAKALDLRSDFNGLALRQLARRTKDSAQARRLLALAEVYDGASRSVAARIGGVTLQSVRDWVLRFNLQGPDGLIDLKAPGPSPKLNDGQRQALKEIVEQGPIPAIHGVVRWRLIDLVQWIYDEFGISLDETTVGRELKAMGYRKLSARPRHHAQNEYAVEEFKKILCRVGSDPGAHRQGRKYRNLVSRRSARRSEKQDYPALGPVWHASHRSTRSAHQISLYLRCNLPATGRSHRSHPALVQHCGDGCPSGRNQRRCRTWCSRSSSARSGRMAHHGEAEPSRQHHDLAVTGQSARTEPGGKHLAVHARQLVVQPDLRIIRPDRRSLLRGLEPAT